MERPYLTFILRSGLVPPPKAAQNLIRSFNYFLRHPEVNRCVSTTPAQTPTTIGYQ